MTDSAPEIAKSRPETCLACGYSLLELRVEVCPECGDEAVARWEGRRAEREALLRWYRASGDAPILELGIVGVGYWLLGTFVLVSGTGVIWLSAVLGLLMVLVIGMTASAGRVVAAAYPAWHRDVVRAYWRRNVGLAAVAWVVGPVVLLPSLVVGPFVGAGVAVLVVCIVVWFAWRGRWSERLGRAGVVQSRRSAAATFAVMLCVLGLNVVLGVVLAGILLFSDRM